MTVQYCCVCGRGSDRTWNNTSGSYVGCDFHTQALFLAVVASTPSTGPMQDNSPEGFGESENS